MWAVVRLFRWCRRCTAIGGVRKLLLDHKLVCRHCQAVHRCWPATPESFFELNKFKLIISIWHCFSYGNNIKITFETKKSYASIDIPISPACSPRENWGGCLPALSWFIKNDFWISYCLMMDVIKKSYLITYVVWYDNYLKNVYETWLRRGTNWWHGIIDQNRKRTCIIKCA